MFISELKSLIEKTGLSVAKFAARVGIHEVQIGRYLSGKNEPRSDVIKKIQSVYPEFMAGNTNVYETHTVAPNQIPVSGSIDAQELFNELKKITGLLLEEKDKLAAAKDQLYNEVVKAKEEVIQVRTTSGVDPADYPAILKQVQKRIKELEEGQKTIVKKHEIIQK